ncbi:hypothetical protein K461DRAFT_281167 [Myriangium duriaei CBS 260.36]|uniref:Acyl-coenzyme A diphosphatase SCS3 n=1 Tax=Myriangium duriaei CBS 260.36 TaxID=1168546 RepID=A0A9P4ITX8_9PEZI|nr:hypothetical protein K461DRAFT_281167 [Myriangium duriaei CBS 260.36]
MSTQPSSPRTTIFGFSPLVLLTLAYPLTLALGSLYSLTIPASSPYNALTQSHDPATAPSYFARKDNLINIYFVKRGWFWFTLALFVFQYYQHYVHTPSTRRLAQAATRYAVATAVWILITQWAFGPAIVDRTFAASGGLCDLSARAAVEEARTDNAAVAAGKKVEGIVTGAGCRAAGGAWRGGHDISGHVFLLILGSGMLVLETVPFVQRRWNNMHIGTKAALGTAALSWWMLLMTATYFHTWFEKLTGLVVAFTTLGVMYILPKEIEAVKQVLGQPGS